MKKFLWLCSALIAMQTYVSPVMAEPSETLAGTWMLDVTESEQSMLRARPFQDAQAFIMMPPMGMIFFKFDGDTLVTGSLPDVGDAVRFRRTSRSASKISYASNLSLKEEIILVSVLNENQISITYPSLPASQYFLWKRVKLDPSKRTPSDYRPEFDAYIAMLKNLWEAFGFPSGTTADTNKSAEK